MVFEFFAVLTSMLFSGAAIYINLAEHPARMECGTEIAATVFGPSYRRAAVMQAALALAGTIAGISEWLRSWRVVWLVGTILIFAVVPFTFFVIMPTNKRLLDPALDRTSEAAHRLLQRWGRLHGIRSILGLLSAVSFLAAALWLPKC
jgi:Domain of unknown function (DUF1772)